MQNFLWLPQARSSSGFQKRAFFLTPVLNANRVTDGPNTNKMHCHLWVTKISITRSSVGKQLRVLTY